MLEVAEFRCTQVRRLLADYLNGTIDVANAQRLRFHFGKCKDCRMIVQSAIETFRANFREDPVRVGAEDSRAA